jgi:hypothetical protein
MQFKSLLACTAVLAIIPFAQAENVTQAQTCGIMADLVIEKLGTPPASAPAGEIPAVISTLQSFSDGQGAIVDAGITKSAEQFGMSVDAIKPQVDAQGSAIRGAYAQQFPDTKLYQDFVVSLKGCANGTAPEKLNVEVPALKDAVDKLTLWALRG